MVYGCIITNSSSNGIVRMVYGCIITISNYDGIVRMVYGCVITNSTVPMGLTGWVMVV
jgi:hypothetical protein